MSPEVDNPVNVVLMWHMHQPQYQNKLDHSFRLPWTYLHCIKDYCDMASALEEVPQARAVVNFSAALLEQIDEYANQFDQYFSSGASFGDELLNALASATVSSDLVFRKKILQQCQRANEKNLIRRYPQFSLLVDMAKEAVKDEGKIAYLNDQYFHDLVVWYHLAWMGETVKLESRDCQYLIGKQKAFSHEDRQLLLELMATVIRGIIPSYYQLWSMGRIELSFTPENHPIIPLLLDFKKAREALPESPLPAGQYPHGRERAMAQIESGLAIFEKHFQHRPTGCWPAEGAVCSDTLTLLADAGLQWSASGAGVLRNSMHASGVPNECIHHMFQFSGQKIGCFFRDDNLSDLIGFTFHDWNPEDAANHLLHHIENIQAACAYKPDTIVPIILDGENCWEYYRGNGHDFLRKLYAKLGSHRRIKLTTFNEYLQQHYQPSQLPTLVAGSWVYGNLATWIGDKDKNRGWEMLVKAKQTYDRVIDSLPPEQQQLAEKQLSICESSDWFWWFGDYNSAETVSDFDQLFRQHLKNLYHALELSPPDFLEEVISVGHGKPEMDGTMRRGGA